ncbi:MAG TPA: dTDP-4-dehydrorhamnose reductase [Candidatus Binatia bacterium]|nr:dTDP-4-dehydrorhamnose reductase [Candidatus Binatia bacterium]
MKRVLLIGGSGQLGTEITKRWRDCEIVAPPHAELDLAASERVREELDRLHPDVVVNAAAFHDVDRCEVEPERAFAINAVAVGEAARLAREREIVFVTISTDYIFDGAASRPYAESDAPNPLSVYGASKLAGERLVAGLDARAFVVRTCGLYGDARESRRPPLIRRVLSHPSGAQPLRVVADVVASPTFAGDLAVALRRLIESDAYGLYHAVNAGPVSWYDFAREAIARAGVAVAVEPIEAAEWKATAVRPRFSALANEKLGRLGIEMPSWRDGIAAFLGSSRTFN